MSEKKRGKIFDAEEVSAFCSQFAMIIKGGIPLYDGTHMLYAEMEEGKTKNILKAVDEKIRDNSSLYEALEGSGAFPDYMIHMVRVGEMTGKLDEVLESLAEYYDRECRVKAGIRSAVVYPIMLFGMMAVVVFILVSKILPMFESVFLEMDGNASTAGTLMSTSMLTGKILAIVVAILAVVIILLAAWYRTRAGHKALHQLIYLLPFTGRLSDQMETGKFIAALSVMTASGVETVEAMEWAGAVIENPRVEKKILKCKGMLLENSTLEEAMIGVGILSGIDGRMLEVGMKAGVGDTVLAQLSSRMDEESGNRLNSLATYLETILVVLLSLIVGAVLLSVMMPLVSVISSIG